MALIHSIEKNGNILFRYRGQIPTLLFVLAIPVIYISDYSFLTANNFIVLTSVCGFVSFLGFVVRAWSIGTTPKGTSGRNTSEQVAEGLNSKGIYSMVRHPLYLGNYLMWIGIVAFTFNIWFILTVSLLFWIYYERIMFAEERFLERKFGDAYLSWSVKAPAFLPRFSLFVKSEVPFSLKSVLRREYSGFLATVIGFIFVDFVRLTAETGELKWKICWIYVLAPAVVITLVLRTLKHHTQLLTEEDRS